MKEIKKFLKSPLFLFQWQLAAKFVLPIPIFLTCLVPLDVDMTESIITKLCEVWSESNIFCTLVTMAMAAILNFQPPKSCHTLRWIPIFFGLSRSTRCGCCSYQVSSISVRRVTCYDHFSVFLFFRMAVSMATAAILKK